MRYYCINCGHSMEEGDRFCMNCGTERQTPPPLESNQPANMFEHAARQKQQEDQLQETEQIQAAAEPQNNDHSLEHTQEEPIQAEQQHQSAEETQKEQQIKESEQNQAEEQAELQKPRSPEQNQAEEKIHGNARPLSEQSAKHGSVLKRTAIFTTAAVVLICTVSYFLFFAPKPTAASDKKTSNPVSENDGTTKNDDSSSLTSDANTQTVKNKTITVSMEYDSGEGVYSGEMKNGIPDGEGSFTMKKSDNAKEWSYIGEWESGTITGKGEMTQGAILYKGTFKSGMLNGTCEITDNGILRFKGQCEMGRPGKGKLYTKSGTLIYDGAFENDMLAESEAAAKKRGNIFMKKCEDMDAKLYAACLKDSSVINKAVAVWGNVIAMSEQNALGSLIIGHMDNGSYPVCIDYRYRVDEAKVTGSEHIKAYGVIIGTYEYEDANGDTKSCPRVEVLYWEVAE